MTLKIVKADVPRRAEKDEPSHVKIGQTVYAVGPPLKKKKNTIGHRKLVQRHSPDGAGLMVKCQ
jgi:hypothetical protein